MFPLCNQTISVLLDTLESVCEIVCIVAGERGTMMAFNILPYEMSSTVASTATGLCPSTFDTL